MTQQGQRDTLKVGHFDLRVSLTEIWGPGYKDQVPMIDSALHKPNCATTMADYWKKQYALQDQNPNHNGHSESIK